MDTIKLICKGQYFSFKFKANSDVTISWLFGSLTLAKNLENKSITNFYTYVPTHTTYTITITSEHAITDIDTLDTEIESIEIIKAFSLRSLCTKVQGTSIINLESLTCLQQLKLVSADVQNIDFNKFLKLEELNLENCIVSNIDASMLNLTTIRLTNLFLDKLILNPESRMQTISLLGSQISFPFKSFLKYVPKGILYMNKSWENTKSAIDLKNSSYEEDYIDLKNKGWVVRH